MTYNDFSAENGGFSRCSYDERTTPSHTPKPLLTTFIAFLDIDIAVLITSSAKNDGK